MKPPYDLDRFLASVVADPSGCWLWTGPVNAGRYATWGLRTMRYAYRWAYEYFVAPLTRGLTLDHLCRQPAGPCVNPTHLEEVARAENKHRATGPTGRQARVHDGTCDDPYCATCREVRHFGQVAPLRYSPLYPQ